MVYVAQSARVFREYGCGWKRAVRECHILQGVSIDKPFESFDRNNILVVTEDSIEKSGIDEFFTCERQQNDYLYRGQSESLKLESREFWS